MDNTNGQTTKPKVMGKVNAITNRYYVHGVKESEDQCTCVADDVAEFWTVYERLEDGTSNAIFDTDDNSRRAAEEIAARMNELATAYTALRKSEAATLRRYIKQYAESQVDLAFKGSLPPDEWDGVLEKANRAWDKLDSYITNITCDDAFKLRNEVSV